MQNGQKLKRCKPSTVFSHSLNLNSKLRQSLRRKGVLLFLSEQVGFLLAQLREDTASITWREDEESIFVVEPELEPCCPCGSLSTVSEAECRRPCKKELRKGMAESSWGGSCMALGPQKESWRPGDVSASLLPDEVILR